MTTTENSANTLVTFRGFGILTFEEENERAKISIIRGEGHKLSVNIEQPVFVQQGDGSKKLEYQKLASYRTDDLDEDDIYLPVGNVSLEVSATENPAFQGCRERVSESDFDRQNVEEKKDFRWVVQMDELYGKEVPRKNVEDIYTTTNLIIKNATFFAYELDDEWRFEKFEIDGDEAKDLTPFGTVAETIGAEIEADTVRVTIKANGEEYVHEFSNQSEGPPFRVSVENVDEDGNDVSDLQYYEKCFEIGDANPVRLAGNNTGDVIKTENAIDDSNGSGFCHPVKGGGGG